MVQFGIMKPEYQQIRRGQKVFREAFRDIGRPLVFKLGTELVDPSGLAEFRHMLREGRGGLLVSTHFSALDPMWVMAETTRDGLRSIHMTGPIRVDRTNPTLARIMSWTGVDMVPVVTPEAFKRDQERETPRGYKQGEGVMAYQSAIADAIKHKGLGYTSATHSRQDTFQPDPLRAIAGLIHLLAERHGLKNFGVHFVAPELPGVSEYATHKGIPTAFKRARIRHGATFIAHELMDEARKSVPQGLNGSKKRKVETEALSNIIFRELAKVAPANYQA